MSWNNNYNNNYGNNRNYGGNSRYNNNYNSGNNQQMYKKSGATYSKIRNGNFEGATIVNAWRSTKQGLMTATVTPYAKNGGDELVTSRKGNEFQKMICTILMNGQKSVYPVLMNTKSKVIVISDLSLCITPNGSGMTRSGKRVTGYFGSNFKRR